mmetsp:Transcript_83317/g.257563  ORF Transcript_83317/g.257563 Transcript_83317/m.257563 type:complete len:229 (-) Transcript_83317:536-1222(-)
MRWAWRSARPLAAGSKAWCFSRRWPNEASPRASSAWPRCSGPSSGRRARMGWTCRRPGQICCEGSGAKPKGCCAELRPVVEPQADPRQRRRPPRGACIWCWQWTCCTGTGASTATWRQLSASRSSIPWWLPSSTSHVHMDLRRRCCSSSSSRCLPTLQVPLPPRRGLPAMPSSACRLRPPLLPQSGCRLWHCSSALARISRWRRSAHWASPQALRPGCRRRRQPSVRP